MHPARDVSVREEEDSHQVQTGTGPTAIATRRNTAICYRRANGDTNIAGPDAPTAAHTTSSPPWPAVARRHNDLAECRELVPRRACGAV